VRFSILRRYNLRFAAMRSWIITDTESPGLRQMTSRISAFISSLCRQSPSAINELRNAAPFTVQRTFNQAARPKTRRRLRPDHIGVATFSGRFLEGSCERLRQVLIGHGGVAERT